MTKFQSFMKDESGATAIEYGLLAALIGVAIIAGAKKLGTTLDNMFGDTADCLNNSGTTCTVDGSS